MEVITYSLRAGQRRSDDYFRDVAAFADEVLREVAARLAGLPEDFRGFVAHNERETPRTRAEYALELLVLGVLWRVYADRATELREGPRALLSSLQALRRAPALKAGADALRGVLETLALPHEHDEAGEQLPRTVETLGHLLDWLDATGDFKQEVLRLRAWRDYLEAAGAERASAALGIALAFAAWFEARSLETLGRYTPNVEQFLAQAGPRYRWREDQVFCLRRRVEYHLNMLATEILNRAYHAAFLAAPRKMVVLPPCMRAHTDSLCQARSEALGALCGTCTPGCHVQQLTRLGEKYGFEVRMLPDDLRTLSAETAEAVAGARLGIVGVSCVLTNAPGGWEARALGIPAQGLPLDYCGCAWHWDPDGFSTDVNFGQLLCLMAAYQE